MSFLFDVENSYVQYLAFLRHLVAIDTVYDNPDGIQAALLYCQAQLQRFLPSYDAQFDREGNLVAVCKDVEVDRPLVYLSAHIDTVTANKDEWDVAFDPFVPYENAREIVGRGVSDCKAGVAYQLFLAQILSSAAYLPTNIVFTISRREENAGTSAKEIGYQLGSQLPLSGKTYLFTLENNVQVHPRALFVNHGERGSVGIELVAELQAIRHFLRQDVHLWNPTNIEPVGGVVRMSWDGHHQAGGHAATMERDKNLLYLMLVRGNIDGLVVRAGDGATISQVPAYIETGKLKDNVLHRVIFDLRTLARCTDITETLQTYNLAFRVIKTLDYGYDIRDKLFADALYETMRRIEREMLPLTFETNPGGTDSGTIYYHCPSDKKDALLPITMGPGTRSQRGRTPPRLSHGVNETFDKEAGLQAVLFISHLLDELGVLHTKIDA